MSISKEGITLPGEAEDKCCWCLPVKIGTYIMGLWILVYVIMAVVGILGAGMDFLWLVLNLVALAPLLLAFFYWERWMKADMEETRQSLSKGCMLMILSNLISMGIGLISWFSNKGEDGYTFCDFMIVVLVSGITCLCFFYYAGVCKRFASQAGSGTTME